MRYDEQKLQMQCVAWFRSEYPQYAMLLTHPINEGGKNTARTGGMHKAEGTQAGVPDLLFFLPATIDNITFHGLGYEFKEPKKGKQSQAQKDFEKMFRAAGYEYEIIRYLDEFKILTNTWISCVEAERKQAITVAHTEITKAAEEREKEKFYKIIGKE